MNLKKTVQITLFLFLLLGAKTVFAQNSMGIGTDTPNPNAVLELASPTDNQGFLVPRMTTTQRTDAVFTGNLTDTENGLMVFDTDEGQFYFWMSGSWQAVSNMELNDDDSTNEIQDLEIAGDILRITNNSTASDIDLAPYLDNTDNQDASQVPFTPAGNLVATNVQAALEEIDGLVGGLGAGDMQAAVYDLNANNIADSSEYAFEAGIVNGLSVETAVPAGAVFTDNQSALDVTYDNGTSGLSATEVQTAIDEVFAAIVGGGGGDMLAAVYDQNTNNLVDRAESADSLSADFIDGVTLAYNITGQYIEVPDDGISDAKISGVSPGKLLPGGAADGDILFYDQFGSGWTPTSTISSAVIDASETTDGQLLVASGGNWLPGFPDATSITYDNATSGLTGIFDVQAAIDKLANQISTPPAVSLQDAYDNGNSITTSGGNPFTISGSEPINITSGTDQDITISASGTGRFIVSSGQFSINASGEITGNVGTFNNGLIAPSVTIDAGANSVNLNAGTQSNGNFNLVVPDLTANSIIALQSDLPGTASDIPYSDTYTAGLSNVQEAIDQALTYDLDFDGVIDMDKVASASILNNAVTTTKLANGAITSTKLGTAAVTTTAIEDGAVSDAKLDKANIPLSGFGNATADLNMGGFVVTNLAEPVNGSDAATKDYVDGLTFSGVFGDLSGIPSGLLDGDDDTQLTEGEVDAFVANNGYLASGSTKSDILIVSSEKFFLLQEGTGTFSVGNNGAYKYAQVVSESPNARIGAEINLPDNSTIEQIRIFANALTDFGSFNVFTFPFGEIGSPVPQGAPTVIGNVDGEPAIFGYSEEVNVDIDGAESANNGNKYFLVLETAAEANTGVRVYQVQVFYSYPR